MEGIIFTGIQASGKSTYYWKNFFNSHMRISLDLLNTRNKENHFLDLCIDLHQRVVVDNTNPTIEDRRKYITKFKKANYKITGYYFDSEIEAALLRNSMRMGKSKIPEVGVRSTYKKLQTPSFKEGFDQLYHVCIRNNGFETKMITDEI